MFDKPNSFINYLIKGDVRRFIKYLDLPFTHKSKCDTFSLLMPFFPGEIEYKPYDSVKNYKKKGEEIKKHNFTVHQINANFM